MLGRPPVPPSQYQAPPRAPSAPPVMNLGDSLDDDILGGAVSAAAIATPSAPTALASGAGSGGNVDPYFKSVFDQFVAMKQSCGEPTSGLTYSKFAEKLVKNREDLMAKTGCKEVKFTVYVKDGKAALKATPVKDD
jgi:hypothetical protein